MASFDESYLLASSSTSLSAAACSAPSSTLCWSSQKSGLHFTSASDASTVASLSQGPSYEIRAAPVSRHEASRERWTAVVPQKHQGQIWTWNAQLDRDGGFVAEPQKQVHKVKGQPQALLALAEHTLVYVDSEGQVIMSRLASDTLHQLTTLDLGCKATQHRLVADPDQPDLFACFAFSTDSTIFSLIKLADQTIQLVTTAKLPQLLDISYSFSRRILTTLSTHNHWKHFKLTSTNELEEMRDLPLHPRFSLQQPADQSCPTYLLPLYDSFCLCAWPSKDGLLCTLWDLVHGVVLAQATQLAGQPQLVHCYAGLAAVLINTSSTETRILATPYALPPASKLSLVVGRAKATKELLHCDEAYQRQQDEMSERWREATKLPFTSDRRRALEDGQHEARVSLLASLAAAKAQLDDLFGQWLSQETRRHQEYVKRKTTDRAKYGGKQHKEMVAQEAAERLEDLPTLDKSQARFLLHSNHQPPLPQAFTRSIVQLAMASSEGRSSKTLRYLIERGALQDDLLDQDQSLLLDLQGHNSPLLVTALSSIREIKESDLIKAFRNGYAQHKAEPSRSPRDLRLILSKVVSYSSTAKLLRQALSMLTMEEVTLVLDSLRMWLMDETQSELKPSVRKTATFLACLLDAHLVSILQSSNTHEIIVKLQAELVSIAQANKELSSLNGTVLMLHREHERAVRRTTSQRGKSSLRKARKEMLEDYQVETFEI